MNPQQIISIQGVPRSGTSWLGQIFDSHPDVAYRHQPLFAYRFKNRLHLDSTIAEIYEFFQELYNVTDDEFILDFSRKQSADEFWQKAEKRNNPDFLVLKLARHHHLTKLFLDQVEEIRIVGIVRHPCAVINSWLKAPKEFLTGWDAREEWRYAPKKNSGRIEEFYGFEKWKEVAEMFLRFQNEYPQKFILTRYEELLKNTKTEMERLFHYGGLSMHQQTLDFIQLSHSKHDPDPYSVIKNPNSLRKWEDELDPYIANEILSEISGTELEQFLK